MIEGYKVKQYNEPVKRYCRMLDLKDDAELIRKYRYYHSEEGIWKEVIEGIRSVGILEMEIYIAGNHLFMIVETAQDFDWDAAMTKLGNMPEQQRWEQFVSAFQEAGDKSDTPEKWVMMDRMFHLYE